MIESRLQFTEEDGSLRPRVLPVGPTAESDGDIVVLQTSLDIVDAVCREDSVSVHDLTGDVKRLSPDDPLTIVVEDERLVRSVHINFEKTTLRTRRLGEVVIPTEVFVNALSEWDDAIENQGNNKLGIQ